MKKISYNEKVTDTTLESAQGLGGKEGNGIKDEEQEIWKKITELKEKIRTLGGKR